MRWGGLLGRVLIVRRGRSIIRGLLTVFLFFFHAGGWMYGDVVFHIGNYLGSNYMYVPACY